jgi:serine/threonine protein kinase
MATRRKEVPALDSNRSTNRSRVVAVKTKTAFKWKQHEWMLRKQIQDDVQVLRNRITSSVLIVKKVFQLHKSDNYGKHFEVKVLEMLPECNRVVNMLAYAHACPDIYHGTALFEYCPLGDLSDWKKAEFDHKNFKPVPEAYIWRFFIQVSGRPPSAPYQAHWRLQMSQALAFIHNSLGPNQESRHCLLHRDIKPKNILVVHNGTTYPSFKLHDFGCGTFDTPENRQKSTYCGTFDWQPPEVSVRPRISTH